MDRRTLIRAGVAGAALGQWPAWAQTGFPSRVIRMYVPFAAGGPSDMMARGLAQRMSESLGQQVVVENRPGGGAQIAAAAFKQNPADGHAVLFGEVGVLAVNPSLYPNLSYDPLKEFAPLTVLLTAPLVLMVRAESPFRTVQELVAQAKAGGRPVSFASQGPGTGGHLAMELFKRVAGIELVHVPYKGSAQAIPDLLAGQVDAIFDVLPVTLPLVTAGKARVLGVASAQRTAFLKDIPTMAELGFPDVGMDIWFSAVTLAGTPDPVVRRLSAEMIKAIRDPSVNKRFVDQGFVVDGGGPEAMGALMRSETEKWGAVVRRAGIKLE